MAPSPCHNTFAWEVTSTPNPINPDVLDVAAFDLKFISIDVYCRLMIVSYYDIVFRGRGNGINMAREVLKEDQAPHKSSQPGKTKTQNDCSCSNT